MCLHKRCLPPICFYRGRVVSVLLCWNGRRTICVYLSFGDMWCPCHNAKGYSDSKSLVSLQFRVETQQPRRWHVFWLAWAESTCLQPERSSSKGRTYYSPTSGLRVLTTSWVRVPARVLLNLFSQCECDVISSLLPQFSENILASLRWGFEKINKNSSLKCWSSLSGKVQWWEGRAPCSRIIWSAGRILECNHIVQQV